MPLNRQRFMNIFIDNVTVDQAVRHIEKCIEERKFVQVITPNVDQIVRIEWDNYFKRICEDSDLLLVDGSPLMWIARLYGTPFKQKIPGSDLFLVLCDRAAKMNYKIFLLGAAEGVANKAAVNLRKKYRGINVVGTYSPPVGFEKDQTEIKKIDDMLLESGADLLFVGMGVPKQDIFIYENMSKYKIPVSLSIGGTIDFVAGVQKRAPRWVNKIGFEWFYRFLHDPKRLFKRYFIDDMKIIGLAFKYFPKRKG